MGLGVGLARGCRCSPADHDALAPQRRAHVGRRRDHERDREGAADREREPRDPRPPEAVLAHPVEHRRVPRYTLEETSPTTRAVAIERARARAVHGMWKHDAAADAIAAAATEFAKLLVSCQAVRIRAAHEDEHDQCARSGEPAPVSGRPEPASVDREAATAVSMSHANMSR